MRFFYVVLTASLLLLTACTKRQSTVAPVVEAEEEEDTEAKALLQGIWIVGDTEEVAFRADGDTIYYPDPTDQPAFFRIVHDSLELSGNRYPIIKQGEHVFWFQNQGGDIMQLVKSESPDDSLTFVHQQPVILTPTEVLKMDSVVYYGGERYHWYVAVNPTKYRVLKNSYNSEGVGVQNVYFDNIIHISLYQGKKCIYSHDLKKQMYEDKVPQDFLDQAILGNMQYDHTDADGVHFNATLCVPDEASCYMVETLVGFDGKLSMKLLEY